MRATDWPDRALVGALIATLLVVLSLVIPVSSSHEGTGVVHSASWVPETRSTGVGYAPSAGSNGGGSVVIVSSRTHEKFEALVTLGGETITASVPKSMFSSITTGSQVDVIAYRNIYGGVTWYKLDEGS